MSKRIKAFITAAVMLVTMQGFSSIGFAAEQAGELFKNLLVIFNMDEVEKDGVTYYPIHVYTGIDSLDYQNVGFEMQAVNGTADEEKTNSTTTVYESMQVTQSGGDVKTYTAEELGGQYMFGSELLFDAGKWSNEDTQINITPYAVTLDGTRITGPKTTLTDEIIKEKIPIQPFSKKQKQNSSRFLKRPIHISTEWEIKMR